MQLSNNKKEYWFEAIDDSGEKATLQYRWLKGSMALMHTFVPPSLEGRGIGKQLITYVLDHVRNHGLKIIVYCPFVAAFMKNHPEYNDLVETR